MLEIGLKGYCEEKVCYENTAANVGSGMLEVYSTPSMVALMEKTAALSVAQCLEEGQGTVGISLNIKHVSATPIGLNVRCETILTEIDRKRLVFEVKAYDDAGLIGEGVHERFIITNEKFMAKAESKKQTAE